MTFYLCILRYGSENEKNYFAGIAIEMNSGSVWHICEKLCSYFP